MALSKRVSVAVTATEYRALQWAAQQMELRRYPGSTAAKRPGRGAVLRTKSVAQALEEYERAMLQKKLDTTAGAAAQ
jgi:hypothetical protein